MMSDAKFQNRLIHEKSPYLLQHAYNPVDWYPWGAEAFQRAKAEDKPIFLSIGYSTCHWCHVMEHESFEDPEIAALINAHFIPVKVDREERPDIDGVYMTAVMAMTGHGGWPLTVLLTHDKKPFFGGTYFPPQAKWGSPGLVDVIGSVHGAWTNRRDALLASGTQLTEALKDNAARHAGGGELSPAVLDEAFKEYSLMYDSNHGGFGDAPKFPASHNLSFLLRYWKRTGNADALAMAEHTLRQMARGGMYDHLGGGFHRYSTDAFWQVPHFEKMLYDQAMLARTYLEAYQITKNEFYAEVAREILDYVLRDMQDPAGGFYSAEDADSIDPDTVPAAGQADDSSQSEKTEGAFYLWRQDELAKLLGGDAEIFNYYYGIKPNGNAKEDPHGEFIGKNIIFADRTLSETTAQFSKSPEAIEKILSRSKQKLLGERILRPRPHLDDKILTDWNGLMIGSLAFGAKVLDEPKYLQAAEQAAQGVIDRMVQKDGRLLHRYRDGNAAVAGTLEDYAFFVHGLLDLYESTARLDYLKRALALTEDMLRLFWDKQDGGFYFTAADAEELLFRQKELYDGAIPSGNSMGAMVLARLYHLTFDERWNEAADKIFSTFSTELTKRPTGYAQMLSAFNFALGPVTEFVIVPAASGDGTALMTSAIFSRFNPNQTLLYRPVAGLEADELVQIVPFVENQGPVDGKTTVYVCENRVCKLPINDPSKLKEFLDSL